MTWEGRDHDSKSFLGESAPQQGRLAGLAQPCGCCNCMKLLLLYTRALYLHRMAMQQKLRAGHHMLQALLPTDLSTYDSSPNPMRFIANMVVHG